VTAALQLETERLLLRQWRDEDYAPFAALNADPRVMEHFPSTLERAASDRLADIARQAIARNGWGLWAVELRATGAFIGFVGLQHAPTELPFSPAVELGWRIAQPYWGRGYAPEAAREAIRIGFERIALEALVAFTAVGNTKSRRVMAKLGMRYVRDFEHPRLPEGHPLRAHCLYRITREAWQNRVDGRTED
jgi:RimJ/RimL family protein N-acetyltransferase